MDVCLSCFKTRVYEKEAIVVEEHFSLNSGELVVGNTTGEESGEKVTPFRNAGAGYVLRELLRYDADRNDDIL